MRKIFIIYFNVTNENLKSDLEKSKNAQKKNIFIMLVMGGQLHTLTQKKKKQKNVEWTQRTDKSYTQKIREH